MCGIAGIINFNSHEDMQATLAGMIGSLQHRGPDASGLYLDGPAGMAHARLSIIDLNGGDQPIHNEDRSVWIVFNGEIFNYPELRNELISRGHQFYTQTDTEVLVHLYEEKGPDLFNEINGQFAFAIWDTKSQSLLLGRDRMGIRPLFYYHSNGRLVFGSEIKAIFADQTIARKFDLQTLSDIFTCWAPLGQKTSFEGIEQIPPGHYALFSNNTGFKVCKYWELSFPSKRNTGFGSDRSINEWGEEISALLLDAVKIRLQADVPVGAYLSGGLDSTYTTALIKNNFNNQLKTFSVSFSDRRFDESDYQQKAIEALNTDHSTILCNENDIGLSFPDVIWHSETSILRTAPAPLYRLSKLVYDNNFKVVITGEGADEIFAGYNIFKEDKVRRFWAKQPDSQLRPRLLEKLYPYIFTGKSSATRNFIGNFFKKDLTKVNDPFYSHLIRWQNTQKLKAFFSSDVRMLCDGFETIDERLAKMLPSNFLSWSPLSRAQYIESTIFLSNYLLSSQGDRMAMAHSVEGRYPFLDHRVVELATQIPTQYRLNGLTEKYILKHVARNIVPDAIVNRPKQPYRAPISRSFFGETPLDYVDDLLSKDTIKKTGYFDPDKVDKLVSKCYRQKGQIQSERENMALVGILSTQLLDQQFIRTSFKNDDLNHRNIKIFGNDSDNALKEDINK